MTSVAIIPARGGSRRIPRKNIRLFHGKPIIAYSIEAAKESGLFDGVWVSTEDDEIAEVARGYGAMILVRSPRFAVDHIGTQEIMADAIATLVTAKQRVEYACCIYATAPMLTAEDLKRGFKVMDANETFAYIHGWFYWGRPEWFFWERPLTQGAMWPDPNRFIDINDEQEWSRAAEMYAALKLAERVSA